MILSEDDPSFVQQKSALSKGEPNDPTLILELNMVPRGYKPMGPLDGCFWLQHRKTAEKFKFYMPRKNGKPDNIWLDTLRDEYFELFPQDLAPNYNTPYVGMANPSPGGSTYTRCHKCGHEWPCKSSKRRVSCPNCFTTVTRYKPTTIREQPANKIDRNPQSKWPDIIISDDLDDIQYLGPVDVVYVPKFGKTFFRGRRARAEPRGTIVDPASLKPKSEEELRKEQEDKRKEMMETINIMERLEEHENKQEKPADPIDAILNGSPDEQFNAILRLKLQQHVNRS